jgi:tRNA U34 5-methylaminomethyl-2-thiouridine-forming methyltransferase MnmC
LREGSREYFYQKLDQLFPKIKEKYIKTFGNSYGCNSPGANQLYKLLYSLLEKYGISEKMEFYKPDKITQLKLF